jgi:hypothetical protein
MRNNAVAIIAILSSLRHRVANVAEQTASLPNLRRLKSMRQVLLAECAKPRCVPANRFSLQPTRLHDRAT